MSGSDGTAREYNRARMNDNRTPVTGKGLKKDALSFLSSIAIGVS
jgi:hypothetical protein